MEGRTTTTSICKSEYKGAISWRPRTSTVLMQANSMLSSWKCCNKTLNPRRLPSTQLILISLPAPRVCKAGWRLTCIPSWCGSARQPARLLCSLKAKCHWPTTRLTIHLCNLLLCILCSLTSSQVQAVSVTMPQLRVNAWACTKNKLQGIYQ